MIDAAYRWIFKHILKIGIVLFVVGLIFSFSPTICYPSVRTKVSFIVSNLDAAQSYFSDALDNQTTVPLQYPADVFAEDRRPCELLISSGTLMLISVGPDEKSDSGLITYDPTNGTISSGDLITTLALNLRYTVY